jgi:hypothetical protein
MARVVAGVHVSRSTHIPPKSKSQAAAHSISCAGVASGMIPAASEISLQVENKHQGNFVSLTAPVHEDTGRLFQWDNDFAWSYDGDVTDSIKQRVKSAGGNVRADLRVSLGWFNYDDLDLHCDAPGYNHIAFHSKQGVLDVDMNISPTTRQAVENLAFMRPRDGAYEVSVKNFHRRESIDTGFTLEVECGGVVRTFTAAKSPAHQETDNGLTLHVRGGAVTQIVPRAGLVEGSASQEKWGVKTETLVPVDTLLLSPNHWDGQEKGNKHWFFILKDCKRPGAARGVYNEFLRGDLAQHRKVFEVLGAQTKCEPSDDQLSGVGFSSTRGDSATVVVKTDTSNRAYNIKF